MFNNDKFYAHARVYIVIIGVGNGSGHVAVIDIQIESCSFLKTGLTIDL